MGGVDGEGRGVMCIWVTKVSAVMAEVEVSGGSVRCQQQGRRCHVRMGHKGVGGEGRDVGC